MGWLDGITSPKDMSLSKLWELGLGRKDIKLIIIATSVEKEMDLSFSKLRELVMYRDLTVAS